MNAATLGLQAVNIWIRRALSSGTSSPFIAHVPVSGSDEAKIRAGLKDIVRGSAEGVVAALERYPAASAWLLASSLARNYGGEGEIAANAVWPHVAQTFGTVPIARADHRQAIAAAFRRAAMRYGLVVPPSDAWPVDMFVCQAGVSRAQMPGLVRAFMRAEAAFGDPPRDDTQRLNMWEVRAAQSFAFGLSRAQKIMVWDESAYHAACYADARKNQFELPLAREMAAAIVAVEGSGGFGRGEVYERPRIALVDGAPALVAPTRAELQARIGGRERRIAAGRAYELAAPWPATITTLIEGEDGRTDHLEMSFLSAVDSVAFFDADSGVLLNTPPLSRDTVALDAREVAIASRSRFRAGGDTSQQIGTEAHLAFAPLRGGFDLEIAGRCVRVAPPSRPRLSFSAAKIASGPGGGLFSHPRSLDVTFPGLTPENVVLMIEHPALAEPIIQDIPGNTVLDLSEMLPRAGPVAPLRATLSLGRQGRVLVRASQWTWPGLRGLDGYAFDGPKPPNFDRDRSSAISWTGERLGMDANDTSWREAALAVAGQPGNFVVRRPGFSVALVDDLGRERAHEMGGRIAILPGSTDRLVIRSPDLDARLCIRGRLEEASFGSSGVRRLALASLADSGADNRIIYVPATGNHAEQLIAELELSTAPRSFAIERRSGASLTVIKGCFDAPVDAVRLHLESMRGASTIEWDLALGRRPVDGRQSPAFGGAIEGEALTLWLKDAQLATDCRIAELSVRIEGEEQFRALRNLRGDAYLFVLGEPFDCIGATGFIAASASLGRCVAPETWAFVAPIVPAWQQAGMALLEQRRPDVLLRALGLPLPPGQAMSWVPLRSPIEIDPELLSTEIVHFHAVADEGDGTGELAALHRIAALDRVRQAAEALEVTSFFYLGFLNFQQVSINPSVRLKSFSFERMIQMWRALAQDERPPALWRPAEGRLGPWHHDWCVDRFVERYAVATPDETSNQDRTLRLNRLVNALPWQRRICHAPVPERIADRCQLAEPVANFLSVASRAWRNRSFANLLTDLCQRTQASRESVLADIGFLLRLAPELTAFYLLLWELVRMSEIDR